MFICAVIIVFATVESKPLSPDRVSGWLNYVHFVECAKGAFYNLLVDGLPTCLCRWLWVEAMVKRH